MCYIKPLIVIIKILLMNTSCTWNTKYVPKVRGQDVKFFTQNSSHHGTASTFKIVILGIDTPLPVFV